MFPRFANSVTSNREEYHDDRLVFKLRPVTQERAVAMFHAVERAELGTTATLSTGLTLMDRLDRGGLIKRVTPIASAAVRKIGPTVLAPRRAVAMAFSAAIHESSAAAPASQGLQIIQSQRAGDLAQLQMALADDPSVEFVARVPKRWLAARKKASKSSARSSSRKGRTKKKSSQSSPTRKGNSRSAPAALPPTGLVMWNLQKIQWQAARAAGFDDASDIKVAVLDTGTDLGHPDLPSNMEYVFDYQVPGALASDQDIVGHGTHVGGTIGALINGDHGINGICNCQLMHYKIFEDEPQLSERINGWDAYDYFVDPEMYHLALARCLEDGARVVNLSIGGFGSPSPAEQALFEDLLDAGVCVVAAMGNDDTFRESYPAAIPGVIAVGATRPDDVRATFSNKGNHLCVMAPGDQIWSTLPAYPGESRRYRNPQTGQVIREERETLYDAWPGTSMAAPHVAAAVALLLQQRPELTPAELRGLLTDSAASVAGMHGESFTPLYGFGRLDLLQLAEAVAEA